jgi:hypothetical protein
MATIATEEEYSRYKTQSLQDDAAYHRGITRGGISVQFPHQYGVQETAENSSDQTTENAETKQPEKNTCVVLVVVLVVKVGFGFRCGVEVILKSEYIFTQLKQQRRDSRFRVYSL